MITTTWARNSISTSASLGWGDIANISDIRNCYFRRRFQVAAMLGLQRGVYHTWDHADAVHIWSPAFLGSKNTDKVPCCPNCSSWERRLVAHIRVLHAVLVKRSCYNHMTGQHTHVTATCYSARQAHSNCSWHLLAWKLQNQSARRGHVLNGEYSLVQPVMAVQLRLTAEQASLLLPILQQLSGVWGGCKLQPVN